jgi:hypothetical protein
MFFYFNQHNNTKTKCVPHVNVELLIYWYNVVWLRRQYLACVYLIKIEYPW